MTAGPLAVFTPSVVDVAILEKLFVGRERVLADLVQRAAEAATTGTLAHRMIVGTRGAGKTHLMTLAASRIGALDERVQVAWLSEDPWAISDYEDLLREILDALEIAPEVGEVGYPTVEQLEAQLTAVARSGGAVVVIAENFDQILQRIEVQGQRRLRALIENDRSLLLLVTTTKLIRATQNQDAPFYEFFSTEDLQPFTVDEALDMVTRVREHLGDLVMVERLKDPSARLRFEAIDALAGGQPRMWSLLSGALDVDGIDDLVTLLLTKFDDLTPYYQEQLGRLSPSEAKAVRIFARLDRAVSVKALAAEMKVSEQSAAKTVSTLKAAGWIKPVESQFAHLLDRRMAFYELAEPLARVAFQLKESRSGGAIPTIVNFLSAWFTDEQLMSELVALSDVAMEAIAAALKGPSRSVHAVAHAWASSTRTADAFGPLAEIDDALAGLMGGDASRLFSLPSALRRVVEVDVRQRGLEGTWLQCHRIVRPTEEWVARSERMLANVSATSRATATSLVAVVYSDVGRSAEAIALIESALALDPGHSRAERVARLVMLSRLASIHARSGGWAEAARRQAELVTLARADVDADDDIVVIGTANLALYLVKAEQASEGVELLEGLLARLPSGDPRRLNLEVSLTTALDAAGNWQRALAVGEPLLDGVEIGADAGVVLLLVRSVESARAARDLKASSTSA